MAILLLLLGSLILHSCGGEASEASPDTKSFGSFLLDNIFLLTMIFIFLSAFITAILKERARDRCLKDFGDYPIILELENDNKVIWGVFSLYSNGIELHYKDSYRDFAGQLKTSFILYKDEWPGLMGIYRCAQDLDDKEKNRRKRDIRRTYQPSAFRRILRFLKNLFNTFRDAVNKSLGLIIGQAKRAMPSSRILSTQDAAIKQIGESFVEYASHAYDAVLERLIGRKVVVETLQHGALIEYIGILKEYSANFLEILSVDKSLEFLFPLPPPDLSIECHHINVRMRGNAVMFRNNGKTEALLLGLTGMDYDLTWKTTLHPEESVEKILDKSPPSGAKIKIQLSGEADLILPRLKARIRHRGEVKSFDWKSFFGIK